jgi:hypothetical protein
LKTALAVGGFAVTEASSAAENVFRESSRALENVRDEVRRTWSRYAPRITIGWSL